MTRFFLILYLLLHLIEFFIRSVDHGFRYRISVQLKMFYQENNRYTFLAWRQSLQVFSLTFKTNKRLSLTPALHLFCLCKVKRHYLLPGKLGIYCFLTGCSCQSAAKRSYIRWCHCLLLVSNSMFNRQYLHTCEISRYLVLLWAEAFYVMLDQGDQHNTLTRCWLSVVP